MQTDGLRPKGPPGSGSPPLPKPGVPLHRSELATNLDALAERVARIRPISHRNPHVFYEERSEVAHELRELAKGVRGR